MLNSSNTLKVSRSASNNNNVLVSSRPWNYAMATRLESRTGGLFTLLTKPEELTTETLVRLRPQYVFLPHWSYRIPENILNQFNCVIFHMTDLPYGRGGSPLQNLIARGIYETRISALRCVEGMDAGPVYLKKPFSLYGSAEEIYMRASVVIEDMIVDILEKSIEPIPQKGLPTVFKRRRPEDGNLASAQSLEQVFDLIRMLDAEGYPNAFLKFGAFNIEFTRASMKTGNVIADVRISLIDDVKEGDNQ